MKIHIMLKMGLMGQVSEAGSTVTLSLFYLIFLQSKGQRLTVIKEAASISQY